MASINQKYQALKDEIRKYESLLIAFSGGVDSAVLLKVAHQVLGENVLAVTSDSPSTPPGDLHDAKKFAQDVGLRLHLIHTKEVENENYASNPSNRCYFCKSELFTTLVKIAEEKNIKYIASGTNYDDLDDFRPGLIAADENKVKSPLKDAKLTKNDIRAIAKRLDLDIWDKPASPCLASRIPYGNRVTAQKLSQVEEAEEYLKTTYNIRELRVRHFDQLAKLEVNPIDMEKICQNLDEIKSRFENIGFAHVEVKEFKSGALNELIKE